MFKRKCFFYIIILYLISANNFLVCGNKVKVFIPYLHLSKLFYSDWTIFYIFFCTNKILQLSLR